MQIDESKYKILVDAENGELTFKKHWPYEIKIYCVTISLLELSDLEIKPISEALPNNNVTERFFIESGWTESEQHHNGIIFMSDIDKWREDPKGREKRIKEWKKDGMYSRGDFGDLSAAQIEEWRLRKR